VGAKELASTKYWDLLSTETGKDLAGRVDLWARLDVVQ